VYGCFFLIVRQGSGLLHDDFAGYLHPQKQLSKSPLADNAPGDCAA
jgi:hypothetical protein